MKSCLIEEGIETCHVYGQKPTLRNYSDQRQRKIQLFFPVPPHTKKNSFPDELSQKQEYIFQWSE